MKSNEVKVIHLLLTVILIDTLGGGSVPKDFATGKTPSVTSPTDIALALDGNASTSYRDPRPEFHKWVQFELDSEKAALPLVEVIITLNLPQ